MVKCRQLPKDPQITQTPASLTDPKPMGFPPRTCCVQGPDVRMAPGVRGHGELGRAGPGGGGAVGRGPRLLGDLGAITVSLPAPPFPRTPVGAVKMQDTRPASFSPDGGRRGGSPRIPGQGHSSCLGDALAWPTRSVRCGGGMGSGRYGGYFVRDPHTLPSPFVCL